MAETKPKLNLYQKLLAITEEVGTIKKSGRNQAQNYDFTEHAQVVAEVRARMAKYGVMIMPETVERKIDRYTTMKPGYKPTDPPKESVSFHVNIKSRYTVINADDPTDKFVCEWDAGEALDTSDKATNKATTASEKYFLMRLFKISDKDDPDAIKHEVERDAYNPNDFQPEPTKDIHDDDPITDFQLRYLVALLDRKGIKDNTDKGHILNAFASSNFGIDKIKDITRAQATGLTATIEMMDNAALIRLKGE